MKPQSQRAVLAATFLALNALLGGCFAQAGKIEPVNAGLAAPVVSDVDRVEIMKTVRKAYETPTQRYLCPNGSPAIRSEVKSRFVYVFSEAILDGFFSKEASCEVLASSRFGFNPLDTPEAIKQIYSLNFAEPYTLQGATLVEVRFKPIIKGKPGGEGGAIVYLNKLSGGWKIANIESAAYLGANGFQSLISDYPTLSSDVWADMDYTKSLTRPSHRQ
jgi:hypothetical protein